MKKLAVILLILLVIGSSSLWAVDTGMIGTGASAFVLGVSCIVIPMYMIEGDNTWWYVGGGALAGLGLIVMIAGAVKNDPSYAKAVEDNPILRHVSLGGNSDHAYIGGRFSF